MSEIVCGMRVWYCVMCNQQCCFSHVDSHYKPSLDWSGLGALLKANRHSSGGPALPAGKNGQLHIYGLFSSPP